MHGGNVYEESPYLSMDLERGHGDMIDLADEEIHADRGLVVDLVGTDHDRRLGWDSAHAMALKLIELWDDAENVPIHLVSHCEHAPSFSEARWAGMTSLGQIDPLGMYHRLKVVISACGYAEDDDWILVGNDLRHGMTKWHDDHPDAGGPDAGKTLDKIVEQKRDWLEQTRARVADVSRATKERLELLRASADAPAGPQLTE